MVVTIEVRSGEGFLIVADLTMTISAVIQETDALGGEIRALGVEGDHSLVGCRE